VIEGEIVATLVFPVDKLKKYIKKYTPSKVSGGDDNTSRLYLIKLSNLFYDIGD
jgi:hypothetical protein